MLANIFSHVNNLIDKNTKKLVSAFNMSKIKFQIIKNSFRLKLKYT